MTQTLYPPIQPFATQKIAVDSPHELYVEQVGNPDGIPVIFLHGGPGAACSPTDRQFFDPERYHIILFDQRGCGQSTPLACLEHNTTKHLIQDIEAIRSQLDIESWVVFGGSWGSTLALAYAQTHPNSVTGLILRGVFLGSEAEIKWVFQDGMGGFAPEAYHQYKHFIPPEKQHDLIGAYYELLTGEDEIARLAAAKSFAMLEAVTMTLEPRQDIIDHCTANAHNAIGNAAVECHYIINHCFLEPNQLLDNLPKITHLPTIIVQGHYDIICPPKFAWELHKAWPNSELMIAPAAGHSSREANVSQHLVYATNKFADRLAIG